MTSLLEAYKEYVRFPDVEINIIEYRPVEVLVNGEVNKPGLLTLKGSLNIQDPQNPFSLEEKPF